MTSGVPQSDHPSPLLFNLINDIFFSINYSNILLLNNDTNIFKNIKSQTNAENSTKRFN